MGCHGLFLNPQGYAKAAPVRKSVLLFKTEIPVHFLSYAAKPEYHEVLLCQQWLNLLMDQEFLVVSLRRTEKAKDGDRCRMSGLDTVICCRQQQARDFRKQESGTSHH